ncbi:oplophorus-luciferin 2-monooxygenase non-catalytic subunit-like [Panulirus ornatus]|uniref:oplophorus-luciferin 2-monooxygenase non-catalytic subunit-like n=1 Tax=Panulirus ornatus TaxID=150431 RepID=UPI003A88D19A
MVLPYMNKIRGEKELSMGHGAPLTACSPQPTMLSIMVSKLLLLFLAAHLAIAAASPEQFESSWPCPEPDDIRPCVCVERNAHIDLDCSGVTDDDELQNSLQAYFPFHRFRNFTIKGNGPDELVPVTKLDKSMLGVLSFMMVEIVYTNITDIAADTFENSLSRLESLTITDNFISLFPFDMLIDCPHLSKLFLENNNIIHMSNIYSDSLNSLQVSYNPGLLFETQVFYGAPNLEYLYLDNIELAHVAADTFIMQTNLKYLDLSHNNIEVLYEDSLAFNNTGVKEIKLEGNSIHTVEQDAISGLNPGMSLWLQHNLLTDVPQEVWEPVLMTLDGSADDSPNGAVFLHDNPIRCECNILWMLETYMDIVEEGATCDDGQLLTAIDVGFLEVNC